MNTVTMLMIAGLWMGGAEQGQDARFFKALGQIESGGNPKAIGDKGNAVGVYQLWKIYVDDVNRIMGKRVFRYGDRWCPVKSKRMVRVYLRHYATERRLGRAVTVEDLAAMHCSGPSGHKKRFTKKSVKAYVAKFMRFYNDKTK